MSVVTVVTDEGVWMYRYDPDNPVHAVELAGRRVHRPHPYLEIKFRQAFMAHLRELGFSSGRRHGADANHLLQAMFGYCLSRCAEDLDQVASCHLVEFCFEQLDIWANIEMAAPELTDDEQKLEIAETAPIARPALQYLLEVSVHRQALEQPRSVESRVFRHTDQALIAAEYLVHLSAYSTMAHAVLPQHTYVELRLEGPGDWLGLGTEPPVKGRMDAFMHARSRWLGDAHADTYAPGRLEAIPEHLDDAFLACHGIKFTELGGSLRVLNESIRHAAKGFDVPFVRRELCVEALIENAGLSEEHAELALAGVTLTAELLEAEPRQIWRPKQAGRVLRRPLLQLPHEFGPHLCWRREELERSLEYLLQEACFRRLPPEWMAPGVQAALTRLSASLDREWEREVTESLRERGLACLSSVLKIVVPDLPLLRLDRPGLPGEIDALAVTTSPARIVVVEVKRTQPSYSPAHFRDDKSKFSDGDKSYCARHAAKVLWVADNLDRVRRHLAQAGISTDAAVVEGVLITKYESFASVLSPAYPVVSLGRLLGQFDATGAWLFGPLSTPSTVGS